MKSLLKKVGIGVIVLICIILLGYGYQVMSVKNDKAQMKPPGKLFTVNNYKIHLSCTGSGSPTVILESGEGELTSAWGWIQPIVSKKTRVCSYDRRGSGWSTGNNDAISLEQSAKDLHAALWAAELQDKYILVGHSVGGLYIRTYQERYPDEVEGFVFVDSLHPSMLLTSPQELQQAKVTGGEMNTLSIISQIGLPRFAMQLGELPDFGNLPDTDKRQEIYFHALPEYYKSVENEYKQLESLYTQGQGLDNVDPLPVRIISASNASQEMERLQNNLFSISTNSSRITIPESTHTSLLYKQDHAQRIATVITNLVDSVRE